MAKNIVPTNGKDPVAIARHKLGTVQFIRGSAYTDLNDIAKPFGKRVRNWTRLKTTQKLFDEFRTNPVYGGAEPVITSKGGSLDSRLDGKDRGTFAHPVIAKAFSDWCEKESPTAPNKVYLVWAKGSQMVKVGVSANPAHRVKEMQVGSPLKLVILRIVEEEDAKGLEARLHGYFKKYHSHGEWFEVSTTKACTIFDHMASKWTKL